MLGKKMENDKLARLIDSIRGKNLDWDFDDESETVEEDYRVNYGFHNDTTPRYDKEAVKLSINIYPHPAFILRTRSVQTPKSRVPTATEALVFDKQSIVYSYSKCKNVSLKHGVLPYTTSVPEFCRMILF